MRILIVFPKIYFYGGAELVIVRICNYLAKKGIDHTLLTTSIIEEVEKDLDGTKIIIRKPPKERFENIFFIWKIVREYKNEFDLINVHNWPTEISAFLCKKPVVWLCNEPELYVRKLNPKTLIKIILLNLAFISEKFIVRHYINSVIVADSFNFERFKKLYNIEPHIINYGIDYDYFSQRVDNQKVRDRLKLKGKFIVLHVGMLQPLKNQMKSLEVLRGLKEKIPSVIFLFAGHGEGKYKYKLEDFVQKNSLTDFVKFIGHISRRELRDYFYACNVLLHPILPQGGWLSPFEALCAEVPIVVSHQMTASEIIENEKIGTVTTNYHDAIIDVYENESIYQEMASHGKEWVKENLSWDKFCENMLKEFQKTLN